MLVVDASVAMAWYLEDQATSATDQISVRAFDEGFTVPQTWRLEIANALLGATRRKWIGHAFRDAVLDDFERYRITVDEETERQAWKAIVVHVDRYDLTAYDAAYVELALRLQLPLATIDRKLADAARAEGVEVLP